MINSVDYGTQTIEFEVQRSKNVDSKTKKGMWWLILVIASIVGAMYYKLTGQQ